MLSPTPRACEEQGHWKELTFLYISYDEYDNAAACMMTHSTTAWEHVQFKDVMVKVTNTDVHYKGLQVWRGCRCEGIVNRDGAFPSPFPSSPPFL